MRIDLSFEQLGSGDCIDTGIDDDHIHLSISGYDGHAYLTRKEANLLVHYIHSLILQLENKKEAENVQATHSSPPPNAG